MEGDKGPVCVTGGTGFIGSWLIMRLLDHGYSVRTTVRSDSEQKKDVSFLTSLPGASERLQIFNADLNDPQSFNAPIEGCTGVFHVATPIDFEDREPEEIVTKRTIGGALGILQACLNSKTVKRVVYTSSASSGSAVVLNGDQEVDEMDESFWSDVDFLKASKPSRHTGSYMISKISTERASLEFGEKHGLDVVTLIPSFVVGPFICPKFPISVRMMLAMVLDPKILSQFLAPPPALSFSQGSVSVSLTPATSSATEYCKKHVEAPKAAAASEERSTSSSDDLKAWDAEFVKVDQATLFDLILVSNVRFWRKPGHFLNIHRHTSSTIEPWRCFAR